MQTTAIRLTALVGCAFGVAALSRPPSQKDIKKHTAPLLPRKELLHILGSSQQNLVADYFWIQTIQAVGRAISGDEYLDVYFYADLVTDLDARFMPVYAFAGAAIPVNLGRETWINTAESTRLLEKGVAVAPNNLYLRILLAYNYSYFHKQYRRAAKVLEETAKLPRAPRYLGALATRLYAQAGDLDTGEALAQSLYENAQDPQMRETFKLRLKELALERIFRAVDQAIEAYTVREGRRPQKVEELVARRDLPDLPTDPLGGELVIGSDGHCLSTALERRLRVYEPPRD
jgi:hypothetical protein